jgi:hypothetical protein
MLLTSAFESSHTCARAGITELYGHDQRARDGIAGAITNRLLEPGPGSLHTKLDELRTLAVSRLTKICELISHPESIDLARAVLAEHFGTFTLEPTIRNGEPVYLAHGNVDFLGDEEMAGGLPFVLLQRVL